MFGQQFIPQPGHGARAAVVANPLQERRAVQMFAMAMITAEGPIKGVIARLNLPVRMLSSVRADNPKPPFRVLPRQNQALLVQPSKHVILAGVAQSQRALRCGVGRGGRDAQGIAYLREGKFARMVESHKPGLVSAAPRLEVDATRQTKIPHGVCRAGIGVARRRDGVHRCGKLALGRLVAESVAPLKRPLGRFHDPCRGQTWLAGLGAHVVQHQDKDVFAIRCGR